MPFDPRVHVGTAAAIINLDKELLLIQRKGAHGEGQWSLVGGWVDYGETPEETIARELEEEVDIWMPTSTLVLWDVVSTTLDEPIDTVITILYGTKHWSHGWVPTIKEDDKISDMKWVDAEQLVTLAHADELFLPLSNLIDRPNNKLLHAMGFRWPQ